MFRSTLGPAVLASILHAATARAETLTCAAFKDRLATALDAQAAGVPHPTFAASGGGGTVRRYDWDGVPHLSGKLTCGAQDAFADFYMAFDPTARPSAAAPADIAGFAAVAAASVCALSSGSAEACHAMVATMTGDGLDQYKEDVKQGDDRPQGLQDYDFATDLDAVFYVTPTALSWAVGPGIYTTVTAERPPLVPQDQDKDDE